MFWYKLGRYQVKILHRHHELEIVALHCCSAFRLAEVFTEPDWRLHKKEGQRGGRTLLCLIPRNIEMLSEITWGVGGYIWFSVNKHKPLNLLNGRICLKGAKVAAYSI